MSRHPWSADPPLTRLRARWVTDHEGRLRMLWEVEGAVPDAQLPGQRAA